MNLVITRACDNPFASDRIDDLLPFDPEWLGQTWPGLMGQLKRLDYRGAIVGVHGSGKTTLLSGLKTRLEQEGLVIKSFFLNDQRNSLSKTDWECLVGAGMDERELTQRVVFLDGAEQMPSRDWRRFKKMTHRYRGLVITQHKQGKLPLFVETKTSLEMLREFIARLAPDWDFGDEFLLQVFSSVQGNIREALWRCYDEAADRAKG
ncbi:MAG: hypothetical protein GXP30_08300 [Verrucomicrobia bacterium]|nr:hypothetical protein [Verrucomicrobiota bacterium]